MCWRAVGISAVASRTVSGAVTSGIARSSYLTACARQGLCQRALAQQALLAPNPRLGLTLAFLVSLGNHLGDLGRAAVAVEAHVHEMRACHMQALARGDPLDVDANADLHRREVRVVHSCANGEQVADVHRCEKAHL